jgi:hypothetical protein
MFATNFQVCRDPGTDDAKCNGDQLKSIRLAVLLLVVPLDSPSRQLDLSVSAILFNTLTTQLESIVSVPRKLLGITQPNSKLAQPAVGKPPR